MPFRPRILILPIAAAIIGGLVTFKLNQPLQRQETILLSEVRQAPTFKALDMDNKLFKLDRYIGRHEILIIFFDGELGADRDPLLQRVRERFTELKRRGMQVVAISTALPQHHRQAIARGGQFPFPLLSDPEFLIHRQWGRYDEDEQRPRTGVFVIDRAGRVAWSGRSPRPEASLNTIFSVPQENP